MTGREDNVRVKAYGLLFKTNKQLQKKKKKNQYLVINII